MTAETVDTSILGLVLKAGPVVKLVILLLAVASFACWGIIVAKFIALKSARKQNAQFLKLFWSSKSLDDIFSKTEKYDHSPVATVFQSGFKELQKLSSAGKRSDGGTSEVTNIERALMRASHSEVGMLERYIGWLATTASAAPFIGLFGTVWGIMNAFRQIDLTKSANLAIVAPGISEALIATAIGLFAAIPAAIFYNHFVNMIKRMATDLDCFQQDFLNIVQRGLLGNKRG